MDHFVMLAKNHLLIDVRSPSEYKHAHIPGAYTLPLFNDEERAIVGTAYKQKGRETAIKIGLDFFAPKMRKMIEEIESIIRSRESGIQNSDSELRAVNYLLIYCWRGGMRSAAVAWLLDLYGFKVYTLAGGYKKFRNYVLETFKLPFQLTVVGGFTGSGKTEVLKELEKNGKTIIDLEEFAHHKGSAFGNMGREQSSQEMFENMLALELRNKSMVIGHSLLVNGHDSMDNREFSLSQFTTHHSPIWLEDESQRIGNLNIPNDLWKTMRNSHVFFLDIPFEKRLAQIVQEYGRIDTEKLADAIIRIKERLGGLETKNAINYLRENNITEAFCILLKYYDKWYLKALHNREGLDTLLTRIPCENVNPANAKKLLSQPALENH